MIIQKGGLKKGDKRIGKPQKLGTGIGERESRSTWGTISVAPRPEEDCVGSTDSLKGARLGWTACCISHANDKSCLSHPGHCLPHCHDYHRHQQQRPQMWGPMNFFVQLRDSSGGPPGLHLTITYPLPLVS